MNDHNANETFAYNMLNEILSKLNLKKWKAELLDAQDRAIGWWRYTIYVRDENEQLALLIKVMSNGLRVRAFNEPSIEMNGLSKIFKRNAQNLVNHVQNIENYALNVSEQNTFSFDKFMDEIVVREEKAKKKNIQKIETPQREYNKRYTERANNRIRIGGDK